MPFSVSHSKQRRARFSRLRAVRDRDRLSLCGDLVVRIDGRSLEVSVAITNRGVAPFYAAWPVRLLAVGAEGDESVAELPFVLKTLLPAANDTQTVTLDLAKFAAGETKLLIGIANPLKGGKPFRFANVGMDRDRAGWLTLGNIVVP